MYIHVFLPLSKKSPVRSRRRSVTLPPVRKTADAVVVGAGFADIFAAHRLHGDGLTVPLDDEIRREQKSNYAEWQDAHKKRWLLDEVLYSKTFSAR